MHPIPQPLICGAGKKNQIFSPNSDIFSILPKTLCERYTLLTVGGALFVTSDYLGAVCVDCGVLRGSWALTTLIVYHYCVCFKLHLKQWARWLVDKRENRCKSLCFCQSTID